MSWWVVWEGSEILEGGLQDFSGPLPANNTYILESSAQARLIGTLLGDLIKGGGLGAWSQDCMGCHQVGRGGVSRQITSN